MDMEGVKKFTIHIFHFLLPTFFVLVINLYVCLIFQFIFYKYTLSCHFEFFSPCLSVQIFDIENKSLLKDRHHYWARRD